MGNFRRKYYVSDYVGMGIFCIALCFSYSLILSLKVWLGLGCFAMIFVVARLLTWWWDARERKERKKHCTCDTDDCAWCHCKWCHSGYY